MKAKFEKTFDDSARDYDNSRPVYCPELYRDLLQYQPLDSASKALEIGIGTGKATLPILETGCHVIGIEPGENLARYTTERFQKFNNFELRCQVLQDFEAPEASFDLIYAATAFHWIPEEYGYPRVYELLKKGGTFARFAYHAGSDQGRPELTNEIQGLYKKFMGSTGKGKVYGEEDAKALAKLAEKYGFTDTEYKLYSWKKDFSADEYMRLLKTYPDHMRLEDEKRKGLFEGIYQAIQKHGGVITVYYAMDMQLARK